MIRPDPAHTLELVRQAAYEGGQDPASRLRKILLILACADTPPDPYAEHRDQCSTCHAPIIWAVTRNGARMPVDPEPTPGSNPSPVPCGNGTTTASPTSPEATRREVPTVADAPRFQRGERHPLCTCPEASGAIIRRVRVQPDCPGGTIAHPPPVTAEQAAAALDALVDLMRGTGEHAGHERWQVGECVVCSCGARYQGTLQRDGGNRG